MTAVSSRAEAALTTGRAALPGLALVIAIAGVAMLIAAATPGPVGAVPVAVVVGLLVGQLIPRPSFEAGIGVATKRILRIGIILLGARLSLVDVAQLGGSALGLVFVTLAIGFTTAWFVGRWTGLSRELSALLGIGSAVCGNTAIMASAPIIRARSRDIGLAVATITLCGTVALLTYPFVGRLVGMDSTTFGLWVGLSVQDTSQVVATGAAFSDEARDVATVVKLVRNTSLAAILPLLAWWWQRSLAPTSRAGGGSPSKAATFRKAFPVFVLGFLVVAGLRTFGVIGEAMGEQIGEVAGWAILGAVAGLGLSVDARELRTASLSAVGVGALSALSLGGFAFVAALFIGPRLA